MEDAEEVEPYLPVRTIVAVGYAEWSGMNLWILWTCWAADYPIKK